MHTPLLDRLLTASSQSNGYKDSRNDITKTEYIEAVLRDLQNLLNTRIDGYWKDTVFRDTVMNYGLPDLGTSQVGSTTTAERIARSIKEAIELFEPRLKGVQVVPCEYPYNPDKHTGLNNTTNQGAKRCLQQKFTITAELAGATVIVNFPGNLGSNHTEE